jgi:DNA polymerase elongation subunit (family B)
MPGTTLSQSVDFAKLLMTAIGKDLYDKPNALVMEAEKVLVNLMLCTAKRYAARCYPIDLKKAGSEHTYSKMSCTGLQMQKRDSTVLCKETMSGFFDKLIMQGDKVGAIEAVRTHITKLYAEELPLSYFKLTKKISKPCDKYVVIPPHVKAWERQVRRLGEGESPSVGEQFDYVITRIDRKKKGLGHAMVDYPLAEQSGLSAADVDKEKYMETQISNPLAMPLSVIMGKAAGRALLDSSNYLRKNTIKAAPGNLLGFFGRSALTTTKSANKRPPSVAEEKESVKKAKN